MALITGFPIELILLQDRLVVSPAKVTAADADTAVAVLEALADTVGMLMPSKLSSPFMLSGLIFSIQSKSVTSPVPSMLGTVESAPIDIPTIDARSSNASLLAVKSTPSSLVAPLGGLFVPLEVTSDCPPLLIRWCKDDRFELVDPIPEEELEEENEDVVDDLEATLGPEDPEIPDDEPGELMFKSDTLLLLLLLLIIVLLLLLLVLFVKTGSRPVKDVVS